MSVVPIDRKLAAAGDEQPNPDAITITFETFWKAWPRSRRLAKKQAFYQWTMIPRETYPQIIEAVLLFKKTDQWKKDNGFYIPYPFRWLRDERWTDELDSDLTLGQCSWNCNGNRLGEIRCDQPATTEKRGMPYCLAHGQRVT